ncbi:MAG TPA: hypothetical protein DEB39_14365 [Planctomycetaceae bacterium]|nr:hypothetical protein [Planctomycetaceae bacterium]
MPRLYSCEITVLAEGKPLENATIAFHKNDVTAFKWVVTSLTNASGKARMVTQGRYSGVPEGEYVITVTKLERDRKTPSVEITPDNLTQYAIKSATVDVYTWVDPVYREKDTTPLKITIDGKSLDRQFDVGKSERKFLFKETAN